MKSSNKLPTNLFLHHIRYFFIVRIKTNDSKESATKKLCSGHSALIVLCDDYKNAASFLASS